MTSLTLDAVLAIAHHLVVFSLVAVLVAELVLSGGPPDGQRLRQLGRLDRLYGGLAMLALVAGGLRAVHGAKGWAFYAGSPFFWTKLALFGVVGLLSIVPTLRLLRWRRAGTLPDAALWRGTRGWMQAQLAVLALIPVAAVLMARGVGI
jgi:putative membrane protein